MWTYSVRASFDDGIELWNVVPSELTRYAFRTSGQCQQLSLKALASICRPTAVDSKLIHAISAAGMLLNQPETDGTSKPSTCEVSSGKEGVD